MRQECELVLQDAVRRARAGAAARGLPPPPVTLIRVNPDDVAFGKYYGGDVVDASVHVISLRMRALEALQAIDALLRGAAPPRMPLPVMGAAAPAERAAAHAAAAEAGGGATGASGACTAACE